jgi:hypothetical protein
MILKTVPGIKEEFRMGVPWYEGKYYVVALKDHVNVGFSVKGLSEQEMGLFEGKGKMMRHVKFYSLEDVDEARVVKLMRLVAEKSSACYSGKHSKIFQARFTVNKVDEHCR